MCETPWDLMGVRSDSETETVSHAREMKLGGGGGERQVDLEGRLEPDQLLAGSDRGPSPTLSYGAKTGQINGGSYI